jgi:uncharacterized protein YutE (UPF0331/DUF86 family)
MGGVHMPGEKINLPRLSQKIADIKQSLVILRAYSTKEPDKFLNNPEAVRSARYTFIVLVEAATNIANHLCVKYLHEAPQSNAEGFLLLGKHGHLPNGLAERLGKMTGFRNLLVHGYGNVDDHRMFLIMQNDLSDLDLFLAEIAKLVGNGEA